MEGENVIFFCGKKNCLALTYKQEKEEISMAINRICTECTKRFTSALASDMNGLLNDLEKETIEWINPFKKEDEITCSISSLEKKLDNIEDYADMLLSGTEGEM
jgi:hypothetical protein